MTLLEVFVCSIITVFKDETDGMSKTELNVVQFNLLELLQ